MTVKQSLFSERELRSYFQGNVPVALQWSEMRRTASGTIERFYSPRAVGKLLAKHLPPRKRPAVKPPAKASNKRATSATSSNKVAELVELQADLECEHNSLAARMGLGAPPDPFAITSTDTRLTLGAPPFNPETFVRRLAKAQGVAMPRAEHDKSELDRLMGVREWDPRIVVSSATRQTLGGYAPTSADPRPPRAPLSRAVLGALAASDDPAPMPSTEPGMRIRMSDTKLELGV